MAIDYFDNKLYNYEDFTAIFSAVTSISKLITLKQKADECQKEELDVGIDDVKGVKYERIPINDNYSLIDDYQYYHFASALLCSYLYSIYNDDNKLKIEFIRLVLNDFFDINEYEYEYEHEDLIRIYDDIFNRSDFLLPVGDVNIYDIIDLVIGQIGFIHTEDYFNTLLTYNRIVHDNLMCCMINKGKTTNNDFERRINKIIDAKVKRKLDEIINRVHEKNKRGKKRSCCLAQVNNNGINEFYFAISGVWDRGLSQSPRMQEFFSTEALGLSDYDNDQINVIKELGEYNNWRLCYINAYTESFYSFFDYRKKDDKCYHKRFLLNQPLVFINKIEEMRKNNQLDKRKNQEEYGRLFGCGERKILSYIKYGKYYKRKKNKLSKISFFIDREPCIICEESFSQFKSLFESIDLHIFFCDGG